MAVTAKWYGKAFLAAFNKEIDLDTDTIKVALVTSSYTPDQDAHDYWDDVSANEVANGNGYTTGGYTLANKAVAYTAGTNVFNLDNTVDPSWANSTITARYAVYYVSTGTPGTSALLCYVDFGADVSSTNAAFTITIDAAGICKVTVS